MAGYYGLIGKKLGHSFSKRIHERLYDCEYRLIELKEEELEPFIRKREFAGLNVTIPYKQKVIPLCDRLTDTAKRIGAVNTLYFDPDGALVGHNTDYVGMKRMLEGFDLQNRDVLLLGATGGTGRTASAVLSDLGARILPVSRQGWIHYENISAVRADFLLNATPVGMYPDVLSLPADPGKIEGLLGVADVIYNPPRTMLIQAAQTAGLKTAGGLRMLVYQAAGSAERFLGKDIEPTKIEDTLSHLAQSTRSIALIGMPGSGKSTVARALASLTGRAVIDIDERIAERYGPIPEIFAREGEARFREIEKTVLAEATLETGAVIATGGGSILSEENRARLRAGAFVVELERPVDELPMEGRPLSAGREALRVMARNRRPLYHAARDAGVVPGRSQEETARRVWDVFVKVVHA